MVNIIGRTKEQHLLQKVLQSKEAEFVAIYGRRRVGKTFLVRQYCKSQGVYFEATGEKDGKLRNQLENFLGAMQNTFAPKLPIETPKSWKQAFYILTVLIESLPRNQKIILFFDELPWMASRRSGLIQALDHLWNTTWSQMPNVKLIVCGSSASWILDNLIHAKGGLYNRLTQTIHLQPFRLAEVKAFLASRGITLNQQQVLELYLVFGGIPFYLRHIEKGKSATQNVNDLCFQRDAPFFSEFDQLFSALFDHAETHTKIIRAIAQKRNGISREELLQSTGMESGGTVKKRLYELEASGFIETVTPYGKAKKDFQIKIIDEYTLFYLHWIEPIKHKRIVGDNSRYWASKSKEASFSIWRGFAFEAVCVKHIAQIIRALELEDLAGEVSGWRHVPKKGDSIRNGAQIDLLIDRYDNAITLCEIKCHNSKFVLDKSYAKNLVNKMDVFEAKTKTRKQLFLCLISVYGMKPNIWSEDLVTNEVTLDDLFE